MSSIYCANAKEVSTAKVSFVEGKVLYKLTQYSAWQSVKSGDLLPEKSWVLLPKFGKGRVELTLQDQSVIRMGAPASARLIQLRRKTGLGIDVQLFLGHLWSRVKKLNERRNFRINTKTAVLGVRGTSYDTFSHENGAVDVKVFEGSVEATSIEKHDESASTKSMSLATHEVEGPKEVTLTGWLVVLENLQRLHIDAKGSTSKPENMNLADEKKDAWVKWNLDRDESWIRKKIRLHIK